MADIVFLYASTYFELAKSTIEQLEDEFAPLTIWWDEGRSRDTWGDEYKEAILEAKCAVVLWNKEAAEMDRQSIMNELVEAQAQKLSIVVLCTDSSPLRGPAKEGKAINFSSGAKNDEIVGAIYNVLGDGRVWETNIGSKLIEFPCFIRSVSSHETLVHPDYALRALALHPCKEPVLISSFDMYSTDEDAEGINASIEILRKKGTPIVLDSGNYESFHKGESTDDSSRTYRLNGDPDLVWDHSKHLSVTGAFQSDLAFQFDPTDNLDNANANRVVADVVTYFSSEISIANTSLLIPILHVPRTKKGPQFSQLPKVAARIIKKLDPKIIAIPERELGNGLVERVRTLQGLRHSLNDGGPYRHIHLLGTGNPISIALLAKAGADSFDGLEWCRTVANAENAHLFHTQHFDFFSEQCIASPNEYVRDAIADPDTPWHLKLLLHNLDFFDDWMKRLRFYIRRGTIRPLLEKFLTIDQLESLSKKLPEVCK